MAENEVHFRAVIQPAIQFGARISPTGRVRGEAQKGTGNGGGMVIKTKEEWAELPTFKSAKGIWYIYSNWEQEEDPETHELKDIPRGKIGDGVNYVVDLPFEGYPPVLLDDLLTSVQVGGVDSGINYDKGTLLEKIFRDMLSPLLYPTLINPSLVLQPGGSTLLEKGTSKTETITAIFDRGSITPAYGTNGYRSGEVQSFKINNGNIQVSNIFEVALDQLHNTFVGTANYAEGEQPKDSAGNDYDHPLPAGSVNSSSLVYEFVNAIWSNETAPATIAKCPLVSLSAKQKIFEFAACQATNPETFDIPSSWNVTAVEVKNDLNELFEDCSVEFTTSDTSHSDAGGTSVAYTRYTCNLGYDMGPRTIRVKWL